MLASDGLAGMDKDELVDLVLRGDLFAVVADGHNRIQSRRCVKVVDLMDTLSNAPVVEHTNACKLCGETQTFARTYTVVKGPTYTLRYFICKHPLADVRKAQPPSTVHPTG